MSELNFYEKRQKIKKIEEQIVALEEELKELIVPSKVIEKLPSGFSINNSILDVIQKNPERISKGKIIDEVKEKYGVELSSTQVQSAISYLKSQNKIEIIGRSVYKLVKE